MGDFNEGLTVAGQPSANLIPLFDPRALPWTCTRCPPSNPAPSRDLPELWTPQPPRLHLDLPRPRSACGERRPERHGLWGTPTNINPPTQWAIYAEITGTQHAASDHAAIFIDLDI